MRILKPRPRLPLDEEQVDIILWTLVDIRANTERILELLENDGGEEEK